MVKMREPFDLGLAAYVSAEAIGEPGRRRFRIMALGSGTDAVCIWLEKEQLAALGDALRQVLSDEAGGEPPAETPEEPVFPAIWRCEFKAGQLTLSMDRQERQFELRAEPLAPDDDVPTSCSFRFGFDQGRALVPRIAAIIAAGRKPCPLCSAPMDPQGHVCVRANGHHPR
ncbi:hypothetical protein HRbin29_00913 [bacterium HR29]|jgi:uncharacterized repeat protein (TIGR03847 family)|nr:hypothetical protein HRbin29_00913 [bacterium HR29]